MRAMVIGLVAILVVGTSVGTRTWAQAPTQGQGQGQGKARKVVKTDREWAKQLTHDQYLVTRQKATEPAFSGKYATSHAKGYYACVCCNSLLFSSKTKFDSGTGWPSFYQAMGTDKIETEPDFKMAEPRMEVLCNDCGAHLGHVFNDGPPPTGLRYCMNSLALKYMTEAQAKAALAKEKEAEEKAKADARPPAPAPKPAADPAKPATPAAP